jgi:hemoglobin/transferrin/lactoferrin receptor protein
MSVLSAARAAALVLVSVAVLAPGISGQGTPPADTLVYVADPVLVTVTRSPRARSNSPAPVTVMQRRDFIEQVPNTVSDLFRTQPGLDVTGVGVNQVRPQIRGQGGQRILLLNDGMRMNNTRRQRDFGELPALVDLGAIDQVEVVRGPASVLYGSDAIAGVVNIITDGVIQQGSRGWASYGYSSAADQHRGSLRFEARGDAFSFEGGGTWRNAGTYDAPAGSFGEITLTQESDVHHSGVDDRSFDTRVVWDFDESLTLFAKVEQYTADDTGFGFVHPDDYNPGDAEIEITYPAQHFMKFSGGLRARGLENPIAEDVSLTLYGQDNERELFFNAFIPFFPGAGLTLDNRNFTDIRTYGLRAEARKMLAGDLTFTYGVDGFQDNSEGRDNNRETITGFGPPMQTTSNMPSIPHARFRSMGAFAQGEIELVERVTLVAGGRYQNVDAKTRVTDYLPGHVPTSASHSSLVGAVNAMFEVTEGLDLIASTGRGFRSPNLVELFFNGAVPEANAFQRSSEELEAEKSFNYDLGARYRSDVFYVEGFYFRNEITDGIRSEPVVDQNGDTVQTSGLDTYENVNLDKIRLEGFEANVDARFAGGIGLGASFSTLDAKDARDPLNPVGESYATKLTGRVGYHDPAGRFWGEWETRHSGEQKDAALGSGNPVGTELPSFSVHGLRGGVRLISTGRLTHGVTLSLSNLTNELYAETANASFFRPEPKRSLTLSWDVAF